MGPVVCPAEFRWQVTASLGTIIALFFYDWRIAGVALLVILPMVKINQIYHKHMVTLQKEIHDTREDLYRLAENKDASKTLEYYRSMVIPQIKIANLDLYFIYRIPAGIDGKSDCNQKSQRQAERGSVTGTCSVYQISFSRVNRYCSNSEIRSPS